MVTESESVVSEPVLSDSCATAFYAVLLRNLSTFPAEMENRHL